MDYLFYILGLVNVFIILAVSLNLLIGFAGLLSLAHAAFMAVGAYVTTLLMMNLGVNFFATLPAAALVAAIIGAAVAAPFLRLKGHIYAFGSFAIMMLFYNIMLNWVGLTRGPFGLAGIPRPDFFGIEINNFQWLFVVSTVVMLLCTLACWRLSKSAFGSTLKAMRGDEAATAALKDAGKPVRPGEVAKTLGVDSKEVSKAITKLKKEGKVTSPKRCYYAPAD